MIKDKLIKDFEELKKTDNIYSEFSKLVKEVENDETLNTLKEKQKQLQKKLINMDKLELDNFINKTKQELINLDLEINSDPRIIRLNELRQIIELENEMIKRELKEM